MKKLFNEWAAPFIDLAIPIALVASAGGVCYGLKEGLRHIDPVQFAKYEARNAEIAKSSKPSQEDQAAAALMVAAPFMMTAQSAPTVQ